MLLFLFKQIFYSLKNLDLTKCQKFGGTVGEKSAKFCPDGSKFRFFSKQKIFNLRNSN